VRLSRRPIPASLRLPGQEGAHITHALLSVNNIFGEPYILWLRTPHRVKTVMAFRKSAPWSCFGVVAQLPIDVPNRRRHMQLIDPSPASHLPSRHRIVR